MTKKILNFSSTDDVIDHIAESENEYNRQIKDTVAEIAAKDNVKMIALAGPTCSGKTTTAERLTDEFAKYGRICVTLSIDDFFLDRNLEEDAKKTPDYESVKALDLCYLEKCVKKLLNGEAVMLPRYDFQRAIRAEYYEFIPKSEYIYLFEGIQAIYPEILELIGASIQSIFISVTENVEINGTFFDKNELRLIRRLLRDFINRNSSPEFTMKLWENVRKNEEDTIYPASQKCDFHISSYLAYETPIVAEYLVPILENVPEESEYFSKIKDIAEKLKLLSIISPGIEFVPKDSILSEFTENCNEITVQKYPYGRPHRQR